MACCKQTTPQFDCKTAECPIGEDGNCKMRVTWNCQSDGKCTNLLISCSTPKDAERCPDSTRTANCGCCVCVDCEGGKCANVKVISCFDGAAAGGGGQTTPREFSGAGFDASAVCVFVPAAKPGSVGGNAIDVKFCKPHELEALCKAKPDFCCVCVECVAGECRAKLCCPITSPTTIATTGGDASSGHQHKAPGVCCAK